MAPVYLPLVSICIPTYNGALYIRQALASALAQRYTPLELIVSDDGSTDQTLQIVETVTQSVDIPVRIVRYCGGGALGGNWNNCARHARGKYIKYLHQDDLLHPDCVARMVSLAESDDGIGMVFCARSIIYDPVNFEHGRWAAEYGSLHLGWSHIQRINRGRDLLRDPALLTHPLNKIGEPTVMLI